MMMMMMIIIIIDLLQSIQKIEVLHLQYYAKCTKIENKIEYIHIYSCVCYMIILCGSRKYPYTPQGK